MKSFAMIALSLFSSFSFAAPATTPSKPVVPQECFRQAEKAVDEFVEPGYYDREGSFASDCQYSTRGNAVVCDVRASKGHGAANDTFKAVISSDCKESYYVELVGEE